MVRLLLFSLLLLPMEWARAQADNRTIIGSGNEYLVAGASAIRAGDYDNGIRLTQRGLDEFLPSPNDRASALTILIRCGTAFPKKYATRLAMNRNPPRDQGTAKTSIALAHASGYRFSRKTTLAQLQNSRIGFRWF